MVLAKAVAAVVATENAEVVVVAKTVALPLLEAEVPDAMSVAAVVAVPAAVAKAVAVVAKKIALAVVAAAVVLAKTHWQR